MNMSDPAVNLSKAIEMLSEAEKELLDGRFSEAQKIAANAYGEIDSAEAERVRQNTVFESARRNIENFIYENWQNILIVALTIMVLGFVFQKQIRRFLVNAKISSLISEKKTYEDMIKRTQRGYFESGNINELTYHIKIKKYSDLIRNVNRQIPLLKEELKKI
jgi:hypothetical protein